MLEYYYRKEFGLSYEEMLAEPWSAIQQNLTIIKLLAKKQELDQKFNSIGKDGTN